MKHLHKYENYDFNLEELKKWVKYLQNNINVGWLDYRLKPNTIEFHYCYSFRLNYNEMKGVIDAIDFFRNLFGMDGKIEFSQTDAAQKFDVDSEWLKNNKHIIDSEELGLL